MSESSQGSDWWMASDGKWYPPQSRMPPAPPPPPPSSSHQLAPDWWLASDGLWYPPRQVGTQFQTVVVVPPGPAESYALSSGLSGVVQGFLWALAAVSGLVGFASIVALGSYSDWEVAPPGSNAERVALSEMLDADDAISDLLALWWLGALVLFVLMIVWLSQAHKASRTLWRGARSWSSGWSVGAWFIPIACAILPKLVITEVERIGAAPRNADGSAADGWQTLPAAATGHGWWGLLVFGTLASGLGSSRYSSDTPSDWEFGYTLLAIGHGALLASGVLGAFYLREVSRTLTRTHRSTLGVHVPAADRQD